MAAIMQMVELILQGVRGFPSQTRFGLAPGHVVLRAGEASALWPAIEALLFVDGRSVGELDLDPGMEEVCRAAITLRAADGTLWRVVRDLRGASALQRFDPTQERFEKIASSPGEIGPYLRTQVGLPNRSLFEDLFTLGAADFPTARAAAAPAEQAASGPFGGPGLGHAGATSGLLQPGALGASAPFPALAAGAGGLAGRLQEGGIPGGLQPSAHTGILSAMAMEVAAAPPQRPAAERIPELERELAAARELEQLQRRLDALQARLFELEEGLKALPQAREAREAARQGLARFTTGTELRGDLREELEAFFRAEEKREAALARIAADREALEEESVGARPTPVLEDRWFWASAVGGLACLGVAFFSEWRWLALVAIPLFGVAAILAFHYVSSLQGRDRFSRRRALLQEREKKVEQEHEAATRPIREAIAAAGLESASELETWLQDRDRARAEADAAERALAALEADPELATAEAERERVAAEVAALEGELAAQAAAAYRSVAEVERELEALRRGEDPPAEYAPKEDGGAFAGPDPAGFAAPLGFGGLGGAALEAPAAAAPADDSARLIDRVAELFLVQRDALLASLGPRASKYLEALTGRRYAVMSWGSSGGMRCAGPGGERRFDELAPRHQDVAWLALRLAAIEAYVGRYPLPLVLDEPFLHLSEQRQALLARMLKGIAGRTQILHRTRLEVMVPGATVVEAA